MISNYSWQLTLSVLYSLADEQSGVRVQLGVLTQAAAQAAAEAHDLLEQRPFLEWQGNSIIYRYLQMYNYFTQCLMYNKNIYMMNIFIIYIYVLLICDFIVLFMPYSFHKNVKMGYLHLSSHFALK